VLKWGNSAAVRLPKFITEATNLGIGTEITYAMQDGGVLLRPARKLPTVQELLDGVTPEKVERLDWGRSVGKESIR
jgi:antitoxin MazE